MSAHAECREKLALALAQLVLAIEELVEERVEERLAEYARQSTDDGWLSVPEAAKREGCSPAAIRMRARRGRYPRRYVGRTLYVRVAAESEGG